MMLLWVALGSALGGVFRYLVSLAMNAPSGFPWGTLAVNLFGSFAIGILSGLLTHISGGGDAFRAFAIVGFCGGFTTFSTFSNESLRMIQNGQWGWMALYVSISVLGGLAAVALGWFLSTHLGIGEVRN